MNTLQVPKPPSTAQTAGGSTDSSVDRSPKEQELIESLEAIDFPGAEQEIETAIGYVQETRADLDPKKNEQWITDLEALLAKTKEALRDFEVTHAEDTVEWVDADGLAHEGMHRGQDEEGFDKLMQLYIPATTKFDEYFDKHVDWLQTQPAVEPPLF